MAFLKKKLSYALSIRRNKADVFWLGELKKDGRFIFGFTWNTPEEFDTVKADIEKILSNE